VHDFVTFSVPFSFVDSLQIRLVVPLSPKVRVPSELSLPVVAFSDS